MTPKRDAMNKVLRNAILTGVIGVCTWSGFGCKVEIEPLTYYKGTAYSKEVPWSSGQALRIYNVNGDLKVMAGGTDKVVVTVQPFTRADDDVSAKKEMEQKEALEVSAADASNPVRILASTSGASVYTGYDLVVLIPSSFDSALQVEQKNGSLTVESAANASSADVTIKNGPLSAVLNDADINVYSGNADVQVWVSGNAGGTVSTDNGTIDFHIPSSANANVSGWAKDGGHLTVEPAVPSTWKENAASETAKTWQCNNGSTKTYAATASGTSLADVIIHAD